MFITLHRAKSGCVYRPTMSLVQSQGWGEQVRALVKLIESACETVCVGGCMGADF